MNTNLNNKIVKKYLDLHHKFRILYYHLQKFKNKFKVLGELISIKNKKSINLHRLS